MIVSEIFKAHKRGFEYWVITGSAGYSVSEKLETIYNEREQEYGVGSQIKVKKIHESREQALKMVDVTQKMCNWETVHPDSEEFKKLEKFVKEKGKEG